MDRDEEAEVLKEALRCVGMEVVEVPKTDAISPCFCCALKGWERLGCDEDDFVRFNACSDDASVHGISMFFNAPSHFLSYDDILENLSSTRNFMFCKHDDMYGDLKDMKKNMKIWDNPFKGFKSLDELRVLIDLHTSELDSGR